jgi:hypothetical protein
MKFSELNKEQKQLLILVVGGIFTLLMIGSNLVITPAKAAAEEGRQNIATFENQVNRGESVLRRDALVRKETLELSSTALDLYQTHLPPIASRYIWALEKVSQLGADLDLQLTVQEHSGTRYIPVRDLSSLDVNSIPMWIPYPVDVRLNTSFENLQKFLSLLYERYPYCSVGKIEIAATPIHPENHNISLLLEWPVFRFEQELDWITAQAGENR